jgi:phytoene dehydrogenase-like protein
MERASAPGGRAATSSTKGFLFNIGPHALYPGAEAMLGELGVSVVGGHPPLNRTVAWRNGERYRLPLGGASLLATGLLGMRDKLEAGRILAGLGRMDTGPLQGVTVRDWLDAEVGSRRVRGLLEALFRVASYGNGPGIASAGAHLDQLRAASRRPVRYLDGGWQTIVDGLRARAIEAGVTIRTAARVERVEHSGGAWHVRLARGEDLRADAVIVATGPAEAAQMVGGPAAPVFARWAAEAAPVQAAALDIALSRLPRPRQNYSIGIDRPLYFSVHTAAARLAPGDGALVHALMYLPAGATHDYEAAERELEWLVDELQPGWREAVVHRRFLPHITVSNALVTAASGGLPGRPGPQAPGAPGLFVAGDWVGPVGMLADAALASGMAAGRLASAVASPGLAAAEVA